MREDMQEGIIQIGKIITEGEDFLQSLVDEVPVIKNEKQRNRDCPYNTK